MDGPLTEVEIEDLVHALSDVRMPIEPNWSEAEIAKRYEEIVNRRLRQRQTLRRCLDAIVWEWDNPYLDPGDWTPLEDEE